MKDWLETLDKLFQDFEIGVLQDAGTVSHEQALKKAYSEYEQYRKQLVDELSEVEKAYLDTLKEMRKKLKNGGAGG
jgi:hypothetical protein